MDMWSRPTPWAQADGGMLSSFARRAPHRPRLSGASERPILLPLPTVHGLFTLGFGSIGWLLPAYA